MPSPTSHSLTELIPGAYDDLVQIARSRLARERRSATVEVHDLVHEVYLRLAKAKKRRYEGRDQLLNVAARRTDDALVDRARRKKALKRGGPNLQRTEPPPDLVAPSVPDEVDWTKHPALEPALSALRLQHPDRARVVDLRREGLTIEATAAAIGRGTGTVKRHWRTWRTFLQSWVYRATAMTPGPGR